MRGHERPLVRKVWFADEGNVLHCHFMAFGRRACPLLPDIVPSLWKEQIFSSKIKEVDFVFAKMRDEHLCGALEFGAIKHLLLNVQK